MQKRHEEQRRSVDAKDGRSLGNLCRNLPVMSEKLLSRVKSSPIFVGREMAEWGRTCIIEVSDHPIAREIDNVAPSVLRAHRISGNLF